MLKLFTSRKLISGMGKSLYGMWSENLCQTMEKAKAIEEKIEKIVQIQDKEYQKQKMDEFKLDMEELKRAFLSSHEKMEKELNERMSIEEDQQQGTTKTSVPIMGNIKSGILNQMTKKQPAEGNYWNSDRSYKNVKFSTDGLKAETEIFAEDIIAEKGFLIPQEVGKENFGGKTMHYFEITPIGPHPKLNIGLSDGKIVPDSAVGKYANSYALINDDEEWGYYWWVPNSYWIAGKKHRFEWPDGINPKLYFNGHDDVLGCGILVNRHNELAIFFTVNGNLLGKQIPIMHPTANYLYPTLTLWHRAAFCANFGDDPHNKPFEYDIQKCPGLIFD